LAKSFVSVASFVAQTIPLVTLLNISFAKHSAGRKPRTLSADLMQQAMVPSHAEDDLQQVLALRRIVQAASITIGPGLGGLAVAFIGATSRVSFRR
jgi:hypothetical protein